MWGSSLAQREGRRVFDETGHSVSGRFLIEYLAAPEPETLYGFPITEAFERNGKTIQFFQKAVFEFDPEQPEGQQFKLLPLGILVRNHVGASEVLEIPPALLVPSHVPACRLYAETGMRVCFEFREFFDNYGGLAQFGFPTSEFEIYNNRIVQYTQYARLEWHDERPRGQEVVLADLGSIYFDISGEDPVKLQPLKDLPLAPERIKQIHIRAFTIKSSIVSGDRMLYVIVTDQNRRPIPGSTIDFVIKYPDGHEQNLIMRNTTNEAGILFTNFKVDSSIPGVAEIVVTATYGSHIQETRTSFRIWY